MKIFLTAIGTQGDIEPFLAVGQILKERGHRVIYAFSQQFKELTERMGLNSFLRGANYTYSMIIGQNKYNYEPERNLTKIDIILQYRVYYWGTKYYWTKRFKSETGLTNYRGSIKGRFTADGF